MTSCSRLLASALFALFALFATTAAARERLAVYVAVEGDPALAENLAEVTIAKLAESGEFELVGPRELTTGSRDVPTVRNEGLAVCVELPACLAEVGVRARTPRAVVGRLRRDSSSYELEFALLRTDTFATEQKSCAVVPGDLGTLIASVQTNVAALVKPSAQLDEPRAPASTPAPSPTAPVAVAPIPAAPPAAPARRPPADAAVSPPREGSRWLKYVGFAAAGLSVVAFSAAAVNASAANAPPQGSTRAARQADIDSRADQAHAANAFLVSGGVLAGAAIVSFAWP
jgi:hypothetical protein